MPGLRPAPIRCQVYEITGADATLVARLSPRVDNPFDRAFGKSEGNADDTLIATGETLAQIQDRVLGVGVNSSSLFTDVPGYATVGVRVGVKSGRHELMVHAENLGDTNYRGISWGVDAPGRGIAVRYSVGF